MFSSSSNTLARPVVANCGLCGEDASLCGRHQDVLTYLVVAVMLLYDQMVVLDVHMCLFSW